MEPRGGRDTRPEERKSAPTFFATTLPGLGSLLRQELEAHPDVVGVDESGHDGRSDIVFFRLRRGVRPDFGEFRLAEDVFVALARCGRGSLRALADTLVPKTDLERGLSVWTRFVGHLTAAMSYRVIARVVDESRFQRTDLRAAITTAVAAHRPRWRVADPADLELWVLEYEKARFVAGLRLSDKQMRQHGGGRVTERRGALRPVVAAAMVRLAGGRPGRLLDPCCGSGTILREAFSSGWDVAGSDIDHDAVAIARGNVPDVSIGQADVLHLPHDDASFDAVVSNLPFGRQFHVADPARWLRRALAEMARVTGVGGRVVVLVPPPVPRGLPGLVQAGSHPLRLLGVSTRIWMFDRTAVEATARAEPSRGAKLAYRRRSR